MERLDAFCTGKNRGIKKLCLLLGNIAESCPLPCSLESVSSRIDPTRLIFIDVTWIKTNMSRYADRGRCKRLIAHVSYGHWSEAEKKTIQ